LFPLSTGLLPRLLKLGSGGFTVREKRYTRELKELSAEENPVEALATLLRN